MSPIAIQTKSRIQVSRGRPNICARHTNIPIGSDKPDSRRPEGTPDLRTLRAHHHHGPADDDKSQQGSDADQFPHNSQWDQSSAQRHKEPHQSRALIRRTEARMERTESFGQQTIKCHRIKDAGLAQHHHQDHRRCPQDGSQLDNRREPVRGSGVNRHGQRIWNIQVGERR